MKTREKVLYETLNLANEKGLGRVSMNDIAERVGIKKPSLYNHFKSKDALMDTMFTFIMSEAKKKQAEDNLEEYIVRFPIEAIIYHALDVYAKWYQDADMMKLRKVILSEKMTNLLAQQIDMKMTADMCLYFNNLLAMTNEISKTKIKNVEFGVKLLVYYFEKLVEQTYMGQNGLEKDLYELCRMFTAIFASGTL